MSNTDKQIISIKELSDWSKWLEVLEYSDTTFCTLKNYLELYSKGEKLIKGSIDWGKIAETVEAGFSDDLQGSEIYLRLVEAHFKTTIKTGAQLWELTIDKDQNPKDKEGIEYSQFLVDSSNIFRYEVYLYYLISVTKDYKELTKIKPSDFNLPQSIDIGMRTKPETKEDFIIKTIAYKYNLGETELGRPPLRDIANLIKAPYSVVLEAYKTLQFPKRVEIKEDLVFNKLKKAVKKYIKGQPKQWREEHGLEPIKNLWIKEDIIKQEEDYISMFILWFKTLLFHELSPDEPLNDIQKGMIKAQKETIHKHFKSYLDEAKEIYLSEKTKAQRIALSRAISNHFIY